MYRAFAPFFMGDKGDRRVTGCNTLEKGHFALLYRLLTVTFSREFRGVVARRQALAASCSNVPTPCVVITDPTPNPSPTREGSITACHPSVTLVTL